MSLLTVSTLVLCTLTLSFAALENPARMDMMKKVSLEKSNIQKPINGSCIHYLYVMAFTSGLSHAGSDDDKMIQLETVGQYRRKTLPDLKGNDYQSNKGDLWKLSMLDFFGMTYCIRTSEILRISIVNTGDNGWNIDSIITYVVHDKYTYQQSSVDLDVFHWIDSDTPEGKIFPLTLTL